LRDAILRGRLRPGNRLPPTRLLAAELGVSRTTILLAFDQLVDEGYLRGKVGSGTYVREDLPEALLHAPPSTSLPTPAPQGPRHIARRAQALAHVMSAYSGSVLETTRPFHGGLPALDAFPYWLWMRLAARAWRRLRPREFAYGDPQGYRPLREAIAEHLETSRGARCTPDQVIIVSGSQQALDLAGRVLLDPGDAVWIEDPGYIAARAALRGAGAELVPVPVDGEGLRVEVGVARAPRARIAFVTPSHQYPLGMIMTLSRRLALLDWAKRAGGWILEDDYNSEFRYVGPPLPALQGLDAAQRVIYVGTFSKTLFPALRVGYLVVPPDLAPIFSSARATLDFHRPLLEQVILAEFLREGHYARHVRRMRLLYQRRQQSLLGAVSRDLGDVLEIMPAEAGMHLIGWLPAGTRDRQVAAGALRHDCVVRPVSWFTLQRRLSPGVVLGYAAFGEREIARGVQRLGQALHEALGRPRRKRSGPSPAERD
jgi:GntR family transcriptional regulator/MocR family aminotransferase